MKTLKNIPIKKICLLSSYACSVFSFVHGWLKPVSDVLKAMSEMTPEQQTSCQREFEHSVNCAIRKIRSESPIKAHRDIFDELIHGELDVSNLEDLVSKTETFKSQYYTTKDVKNIIQTFDNYLKEEIAHHEHLSHLISLQFYESNMKKMESIYNIVSSNNEQIERIKISINDSIDILKESCAKFETSHEILDIGKKCLNVLLDAVMFTLISMFAYSLISIIVFHGLEPKFVVVAPISYFTSNLLLSSSKNNKILNSFTNIFVVPLKIHRIRLTSSAIQAVVAISIFVIILCAANTNIANIIYPSIALTGGSLFGDFLKRLV